jgi:hypothetical protein
MKNVLFIFILILFFGCSQTKKENENNVIQSDSLLELNSAEKDTLSEKLVVKKQVDNDSRIDIESVLKDKHNEYLASFKNSKLSLCCYQLLDITKHIDYSAFTKTVEKYESENTIKQVDIYRFESSFLKKFYNKHPNVMHEDLVFGRIVDNNLIPNSKIKIGMTESSLLEILFQPTDFFKQIDTLTVYENELGESHTLFIFDNDSLVEILFDSDYDWINKELDK